MPVTLSRQYAKLCDIHDFDDPVLIAKLHEVLGRDEPSPKDVHRKAWEFALLALFLEEVGALGEEVDALGVAAGHEPPLFWLANRCRDVLATDIYGEGEFAVEADGRMLTDPEAFAPYPYRTDHLRVQSMDARSLDLADESFDIIFCLSSIEHFGAPAEIRRAAAEMARVLRPGGYLVITTEVLLRVHPLDWPPIQVVLKHLSGGRVCANAAFSHRVNDGFRPDEMQRDVIDATGLELLQPVDLTISPESFAHPVKMKRNGEVTTKDGNPYPHVMLTAKGSPWTSVFLPFRKAP